MCRQLDGNTKIDSAILQDNGNEALYANSDGGKTFYRTNTIANGKNENDTNTLDFEYWFPVNNHSGNTNTGTDFYVLPVSNDARPQRCEISKR